jgi:hypothetical protein
VQKNVALEALKSLNDEGEARRRSLGDEELTRREEELYKRGDVQGRYMNWLMKMAERRDLQEEKKNLTLGYVTKDVCFSPCFLNRTFYILIPLLQ